MEQVKEEEGTGVLAVPSFAVLNAHHRTPPEGAIVVPNPIETYYSSLNGEEPDQDKLIISTTSASVWLIFCTHQH